MSSAAATENDLASVPEWLEVQHSSGRDPLAMQSGSIALYQRLLPGISNVTLRVR